MFGFGGKIKLQKKIVASSWGFSCIAAKNISAVILTNERSIRQRLNGTPGYMIAADFTVINLNQPAIPYTLYLLVHIFQVISPHLPYSVFVNLVYIQNSFNEVCHPRDFYGLHLAPLQELPNSTRLWIWVSSVAKTAPVSHLRVFRLSSFRPGAATCRERRNKYVW